MTELGNSLYQTMSDDLRRNSLIFRDVVGGGTNFLARCCQGGIVLVVDNSARRIHSIFSVLERDFERACRHTCDNLL